jgi:hypothetical protein
MGFGVLRTLTSRGDQPFRREAVTEAFHFIERLLQRDVSRLGRERLSKDSGHQSDPLEVQIGPRLFGG